MKGVAFFQTNKLKENIMALLRVCKWAKGLSFETATLALLSLL